MEHLERLDRDHDHQDHDHDHQEHLLHLEDAIRLTKETLHPIFSKPKLTSKLLAKPPFRFIHDIVKAIQKSTGFPNSYFTPEEMDSKNLKDKASKIAFLEKLIWVVEVCQDDTHSAGNAHGHVQRLRDRVRPSKIVAGLEPIWTNVLLTSLGQVSTSSIDLIRAIRNYETAENERILAGAAVGAGAGAGNQNAPTVAESKESNRNLLDDHTTNRKEEESNLTMTSTSSLTTTSSLTLQQQIQQCNGDMGRTKTAIGNIISRPKCNDKVLGKPPFRFIHDVVMAVDRQMKMGLDSIFSQREMISSNVKGKESKLAFLSKLISHVDQILGGGGSGGGGNSHNTRNNSRMNVNVHVNVDVKPSKIVAGLEPEKTRRFLQLFVLAATVMKRVGTATTTTTTTTAMTRKRNAFDAKEGASANNEDDSIPLIMDGPTKMKDENDMEETKTYAEVKMGASNDHLDVVNVSEDRMNNHSESKDADGADRRKTTTCTTATIADFFSNDDDYDQPAAAVDRMNSSLNDEARNGERKDASMSSIEPSGAKVTPMLADSVSLDADKTNWMDQKESRGTFPDSEGQGMGSPTDREEKIGEEDQNAIVNGEKVSPKEKRRSVAHLFMDEDDTHNGRYEERGGMREFRSGETVNSRPTTARRRPPSIKTTTSTHNSTVFENNSSLATKDSRKRRPFVFKDEDDEEDDAALSPLNGDDAKPFQEITMTPKGGDTGSDSAADEPTGQNAKAESKSGVQFRLQLHNQHHNRHKPSSRANTSLSSSPAPKKINPYDLKAISNSIQKLARSTAPIGKIMHLIPKELERMKQEHEYWSEEYARYQEEYVSMKKEVESDDDLLDFGTSEAEGSPFYQELEDAEHEIQIMKESILTAKIQIQRNTENIRHRLRSFATYERKPLNIEENEMKQ